MEDEAPLLFRIPRTTSSSRRHSKTSGTILDSEGSPGRPSETVGKEQEFTEATEKLQSPVVNKAKKNTKEKVKTTNIPEPLDSQAEQLCPPVDHAVPERLVHRKPIKKQSRVKQAYSEKSDAMDVKPQDTAGEVTTDSKETPSRGKTKSSPKTLKVKKLNAVKHRMEVNKKKTPVKPGRKVAKAVKETRTEDHQEQSSDGHGQGGDPALKSGNIQMSKFRLNYLTAFVSQVKSTTLKCPTLINFLLQVKKRERENRRNSLFCWKKVHQRRVKSMGSDKGGPRASGG